MRGPNTKFGDPLDFHISRVLLMILTPIDSMPTEKAEFGFWGNRHFLSTNRPTLK